MIRNRCAAALSLVFLSSFAFPAFAQTPPRSTQSGTVEKELKKEAPAVRPPKKAPPLRVEVPQERFKFAPGKKIRPGGFIFHGNTVLSNAELEKATAGFVDKELPLDDFAPLVAVEDAYKKKGFFLARAYLPVQDITNGKVTIGIVEGRLGRVRVEGGRVYNQDFILKRFRADVNGVVNYNELTRSLLVLNDNPDLKMTALLEKGTEPYTVDVVLSAAENPRFHAGADYNNFGSKYISRDRFGFQAEYTGALLPGDSLRVREVSGTPMRTLQYVNGQYSLPVNSYGTRASFSVTDCQFDVQREFRELGTYGDSRIYNATVSHPLRRTMTSSLDALASFDYGTFTNSMSGELTSDDRLRVLRAGGSGNWLDNFQGRNYFSVLMSHGFAGVFGASSSKGGEASRANAGSRFTKANIDAARFQKLVEDIYLLAKVSGQVAGNNLVVPEQFAVGGADSVRGYPVSEYLGDSGYAGTLELRLPPPFVGGLTDPFTHRALRESFQLAAFLDAGEAFIREPLAGEHKHRFIMGAGGGIRYNCSDDLNLRFDVGFPVGGQDPSDDSDMTVYAQVSARF